MARIPSWRPDARAACLIALICSMFFPRCNPDTGAPTTVGIVVSPNTGFQGSTFTLSITAEDKGFDDCEPFDVDSLEFHYTLSDAASLIVVESIDMMNEKTVRATIGLDQSTPTGPYTVLLQCNQKITFDSGNRGFVAEAKEEERAVSITPGFGGAGELNMAVKVEVSPSFGFTDSSYVLFGDGTNIVVRKQRVESPREMTVWIDISPESPQIDYQVVVGNGPETLYDVFSVTERIEISIASVIPDLVDKPGAGALEPREYWLEITGTTDDVGFVQPGEDGGVGGEGSQVSFHPAEALSDGVVELPGTQVLEIQVEDLRTLRAKVAIDKNAPPGRALLRVTTEERQVQKSFWVAPVSDEPYLRVIYPPWALERGGRAIDVVVEGVNFNLSDAQDTVFLDAGCTVQSNPLLVSGRMQLKVDIDDTYPGASATLAVTDSNATTATVVLLIRDEDEPKVAFDPEQDVTQGQSDYAKLILEGGGGFNVKTTTRVPQRSGIRTTEEAVTIEGELFVRLDVEQDAPVGQTWIRTLHDGSEYETAMRVQASGGAISMTPDTFLQGRSQAAVDVRAEQFDFDPDNSSFQLDDPAIRIEDVVFDSVDVRLARLTLDIGPTARTLSPSILYSKRNAALAQAAASFRVLKTERTWIEIATVTEVERRPGGVDVSVALLAGGVAFDDYTEGYVLENSGVQVSLVQVNPRNNRQVNFVLSVDESGPGGWIGVLLYSGWQRLVVPIHVVAGDDESLTMALQPEEVRPGLRAREFLATKVGGEPLQEGATAVFSAIFGAYGTLIEITDEDEARLYLDTAVTANGAAYGERIPLALSVRKGAFVGAVRLEEISTHQVSENTDWQGVLASGEVALLEVDPGTVPTVVTGSVGWPGYADLSLDLRRANGLDEEERTDAGLLWITDPTSEHLIISPAGDPAGQPSEVRVKPMGGQAVSPDGLTWEPQDLCTNPFLGLGSITGAFDEGRVAIDDNVLCRLVAVVHARALGDRPWSAPDLWLERRDVADVVIGERVTGWPTAADADPRLYFDAYDGYVALGPELGTAGDYLIQIRRPLVINQINRDSLAAPYVEILAEPGSVLNGAFSLVLYDGDGWLQDYDFNDHVVGDDGRVVIGSGPGVDIHDDFADSIPLTADFALLLVENLDIRDCVQVGSVPGAGCSEGAPVPNDDPMPVFFRVEGIDTNDNLSDFVPTFAAAF